MYVKTFISYARTRKEEEEEKKKKEDQINQPTSQLKNKFKKRERDKQ